MAEITYTESVSTPWGSLQASKVYTGAASQALDETYPDSSTDEPFAMAFPQAGFQAMVLLATTSCDVTNTASTAFQSSLDASVMGLVTSLSADVDVILLTATAGGTIKIRVLYDPTP
jgi:hypothetical protein